MVSYPSPPPLLCKDLRSLTQPPTCLYRPMVSYPTLPPSVLRDPWSLTQLPRLVFRDPWSLTQHPHLSLETHGLLPNPPTCLYRPMVSCLSPHLPVHTHGLLPIPPIPPPVCTYLTPPPKSGSRACKIVLTTSLRGNKLFSGLLINVSCLIASMWRWRW